MTAERETAARLPGDPGMWVFVLGDLAFFSAYFVIFMVHRGREPELFAAAQRHLSPAVAVATTLLLLTGSWLIALAVQASRAGEHRRALRLTAGTLLTGVLFMLVKAGEWAWEASHGRTFASGDFFMFYYLLTGVHLFHMLLGLVVLGVVLRELRAPGLRRTAVVETGATYWHMVDLLWIVIFVLVYLMR
ncbi:cytochrome c oxidase subunit 3 [Actinomadura parmotrematis]|uniref:Cytochrome aa3 subunit 3 n=1 Tax=Actinomadura parmotrematis TaxID=2864039 RepID=A0ABS7FSZ6_9ACTN|nr:cytochrome c oxidase subunit 3 [Actinomadura parmotrematis]MBW8482663.1 cytochrome c oxidase subunit 3 [Actinomadura parmotrematis]